MSVVCPQGHTSESEDYCDICGAPIEASAAPAPSPSAPPAAAGEAEAGPVPCPNCDFPAAPNALFCENCGYDFTTGTAPQPVADPTPNPLSLEGVANAASAARVEAESKAEAAGNAEAAAKAEEAEAVTNGGGLPTPPAPGPDTWVVEVWVDPDWYAAQKPEDPMPSPGSPRVLPLRERSVLVGRPSASRNIRPQIDAGADTGVSRRHCQLSTDGQRWWVEDLGSANGTYVSLAGESLPTTPLDVGIRHELAEGERVYLGGWTRLVVRKALPGEV